MAQLAERELSLEDRAVAFRAAIADVDRAINSVRCAVFRLVDADLVGATDTAAHGLFGLQSAKAALERQLAIFEIEPEERRQEVSRDTSDGLREAGGAVQGAMRRGLAW